MTERTQFGDFVRGLVDLAEDPAKRQELEAKVRELGGKLAKTLEDPQTVAAVIEAAGKHRVSVRETRLRASAARARTPRRSRR